MAAHMFARLLPSTLFALSRPPPANCCSACWKGNAQVTGTEPHD